MNLHLSRRKLLLGSAFGAGLIGLRSLATGLPKAFLLDPRVAYAADPKPPQFLILATSGGGDPYNVNAPGSYVAGTENNPHPELAEASVELGASSVKGAAAWNTLPAELRARLCFFHHATYTQAHPELYKVLMLHGAAKSKSGNGQEMLPSVFASEASEALGTVQQEPVPLGAERLSFEGRALDNIAPSDLKSLFDQPDAVLGRLTALRDAELDALYADLKTSGTRAQRQFLDRFALGRAQVRQLGDELATLLERLPLDSTEKNSPGDQVIAAVALIKLKVAPVISLHLPFGGDNHNDSDLAIERDETVSGIATLGMLWDELVAQGLEDSVTFASLNVFGRNLKRNSGGGRNHNQHHHVMLMFGKNIRGTVIGGIEAHERDYRAMPIDSSTGEPSPSGDIEPLASLESAARTLWNALELDPQRLDTRISGGKSVSAALAGG